MTSLEKLEDPSEVVMLVGADRLEIDGHTYWLGLYEMVTPGKAEDLLGRKDGEGRQLFKPVDFQRPGGDEK